MGEREIPSDCEIPGYADGRHRSRTARNRSGRRSGQAEGTVRRPSRLSLADLRLQYWGEGYLTGIASTSGRRS